MNGVCRWLSSRNISDNLIQDVLLTVNNAFEGNDFVNPAFTAQQTLKQYVELLFPYFDSELVSATVGQYSGLENGNVTEQAFLVMGDGEVLWYDLLLAPWLMVLVAIFVCPSYAMMQGFKGPSFRVSWALNKLQCVNKLLSRYFRANTLSLLQLMVSMEAFISSLMRQYDPTHFKIISTQRP